MRSGFGLAPNKAFATTKTVKMIVESKNDYFIQVKKNQKKLYQKVKDKLEEEITLKHNSSSQKDIAITKETNKGRIETRICYQTKFQDKDWEGLKTAVLIQTHIKEKLRNKLTNKITIKESTNNSYFISSQEKSAKYYLDLKRNHWSVEAFHYIKDITYKEDITKCGKGNSPQNNSCLRALAISIYKSIGSNNQAQSIKLFGNNIKKLYEIICDFS